MLSDFGDFDRAHFNEGGVVSRGVEDFFPDFVGLLLVAGGEAWREFVEHCRVRVQRINPGSEHGNVFGGERSGGQVDLMAAWFGDWLAHYAQAAENDRTCGDRDEYPQ